MKNRFHWMPVYWNDEEIDTVQLTTLEFGAYMLLKSYYWRNCGPIPDNDAVLARAARMTVAEFGEVKANVLRMFDLDDGFWRNEDAEAKLKHCQAVSEQASSNSNKGWAKRRGELVQLYDKRR